ncbi:MAG: isocitrate lyase/phosphoenolpyruvate mutase family protein [Alphaproteobacteria bacterium]|nr:isocitrate lyase/phosphoenolpyruvate mutase family protein [Alphaproteobacteria bacterium]
MTTQKDRATRFRALHAPGQMLILANAWDAGSARMIEAAGAKAIATSSASLAWAHGYPDGEALPRGILMETVREILRVVQVPVTVDSEAGFSDDPHDVGAFIAELARLGAVGINLEDDTKPPDLLAAKLSVIKDAVAKAGCDVFINARIDVYLRKLVPAEAALDETLARMTLYASAGADGLFIPALTGRSDLKRVVDSTPLPVNALIMRAMPPIGFLKEIGVRRISSGAGPGRAALGGALRAVKDLIENESTDALFREMEGNPDMNTLLSGY